MIDLTIETPISLDEARKHRLLLHRNGGRGVAFSTIWKWTQDGYAGATLETVRVGRALATTEGALIRFLRAMSGAGAVSACDTAFARADATLAAAGI